MTGGLIKIGNITIDISEVNQIIDYGSHVHVYFDETHHPKYIDLVGADAEECASGLMLTENVL